VPGYARAQFGDVEGFGEVHLEHRAHAGTQRKQIRGGLGTCFVAQLTILRECRVHRCGVCIHEPGFGERRLTRALRRLVAMRVGIWLDELHTPAVAVHVAEAANVHQDVELEALPGGEAARQFVVPPAMLGAERDDLGNFPRTECRDRSLHLPP